MLGITVMIMCMVMLQRMVSKMMTCVEFSGRWGVWVEPTMGA